MVHDLLYCGEKAIYEEVQADILNKYPEAKFEDGSDYIHPYRFSVDVEADKDEFLIYLLVIGCFNISFHLQLMSMENPAECRVLMERAVQIIKAEKSQNGSTEE